MEHSQPNGAQDHVLGRPDAPVTLVQYGDYERPLCARAHEIVSDVLERAGDEVRLIARHFSLALIHPRAHLAAQAAEAAGAQGKFWPMHAKLFRHQDALMVAHLIEYARELGLDVGRFAADLRSGTHLPKIERDLRAGVRCGVNAVPTLFLGDRRVDGNWDATKLLALIRDRWRDEALREAAIPCRG